MGSLVQEVGTLFGGGNNNSNFQATGANILQPTTSGQAGTAYGQTQQGIAAQQQLMQALAAQGGIQNQSNVYNQLQGVANGVGPNPAEAMLNQATGQNVANQAALMAGQRGAGANAGLIARQAAQQGGALQQQAVGQGATMQANQSLNALGQLGGLAGQQVAQQQGAVQGLNAAAQGQQQNILSGIGAQNNANVGMQSNINNANAGLAQTNANNSAKAVGGLFNSLGGVGSLFSGGGGAAAAGAGGAASPLAAAGPASVMMAAEGGKIPNPKVAAVESSARFPSKVLEPHIDHMAKIYHMDKFAKGGKVPAMVSPGEVYLPPEKAKEVAKEGKNPIKEGEKIPGKPKVKGNSYENDTVPKKLEAGGVVIPNSIMQSEDPVGQASEFVKKLVEKSGSGKEHGDFKEALKKAIANRKAA